MELLYHVNFGLPLLDRPGQVVLPLKTLALRDAVAAADIPQWNVYGPETPGLARGMPFLRPLADRPTGPTRYCVRPLGDRGASLKFKRSQLPCFTIWKNRQAVIDGYLTGREPATNFPNRKSFEKEKGRVIVLSPGEKRRFEVSIEATPTRLRSSRRKGRCGDPRRREARNPSTARSTLVGRLSAPLPLGEG